MIRCIYNLYYTQTQTVISMQASHHLYPISQSTLTLVIYLFASLFWNHDGKGLFGATWFMIWCWYRQHNDRYIYPPYCHVHKQLAAQPINHNWEGGHQKAVPQDINMHQVIFRDIYISQPNKLIWGRDRFMIWTEWTKFTSHTNILRRYKIRRYK